jgi:hypothetical protein
MNYIQLYRQLSARQASKVIDWCETNNQEYDIWNGPETMIAGVLWEIGVKDWDAIEKDLPELKGEWIRN